MKDLDFDRTHRHQPMPVGQATLIKRLACAVCGLRSDVLICKECALDTAASIRWLEQLPRDARVEKALEILRRMG